MTKRTDTGKRLQYTARAYRQHSSLVITVPKGLCTQLEIERGDIILFAVRPGDDVAVMETIHYRGIYDGGDKRNSDRENPGGGL